MKLLLRISCLFSLLLTVLAPRFLPEQYFRDASYLNERANSAVSGQFDSFALMTKIYSSLHIGNSQFVLSILQWLLFYSVLYLVLKLCDERDPIVYYISTFYLYLIPFYGSMLTKEILVATSIFITLILRYLWIKNRFFRVIQYLPFLLIVALTIRSYYFLILVIFIILRVISRKIMKVIVAVLLFAVPLLTTFIYGTSGTVNEIGRNIFDVRIQVIDALPIKPRTTIFQLEYNENFFHNLASYFHVLQQMFAPFSIASGSIYNFLTLFPIMILTSIIIILIRSSYTANNASQETLLFFSFLIVATIFEPDLGSFLRHSFPYLPLLILGLYPGKRLANHNQT